MTETSRIRRLLGAATAPVRRLAALVAEVRNLRRMLTLGQLIRLLPVGLKDRLRNLLLGGIVRTLRYQGVRDRVAAALAKPGGVGGDSATDYARWVARHVRPTRRERRRLVRRVRRMEPTPRFSLLLIATDADKAALDATVAAVQAQVWPHWELWVAGGDVGTGADERVRAVPTEDQGDGGALGPALAAATGDFLAVLTPGDRPTPEALYLVAEAVQAHPEAVVVYGDTDRLDEAGQLADPYFKPAFDWDLFHAQHYLSGLAAVRRDRATVGGGFDDAPPGAEGYDLLLRVLEGSRSDGVRHVPHVLCTRPTRAGADEATLVAERQALQAHLERTGHESTVTPAPAAPQCRRVVYPVPEEEAPLVTVIMPMRDRVGLSLACVAGLLQSTAYPRLELIIVDNRSEEPESLRFLEDVQEQPGVRVLPFDKPYNFSAINNMGARDASGDVLLLLNNDALVIHEDWLREMVAQAVRPDVGAVGAKLLYPNDTVQHAGIVVGAMGFSEHVYRHRTRQDAGYHDRAQLVQGYAAVTAACLATRRDVFQAVGGLDEGLAVAFNDVDFCLRVRQRGYRVVWTPHALLYHLETVTRGPDVGEKQQIFRQEMARFRERWGRFYEDPFYHPNLSLDLDWAPAQKPRVAVPWKAGFRDTSRTG